MGNSNDFRSSCLAFPTLLFILWSHKRIINRTGLQICRKNGIAHPFKNNRAGKAWLQGFMARNSQLAFRSLEPTSIARLLVFSK
jgi:hypothetical protein